MKKMLSTLILFVICLSLKEEKTKTVFNNQIDNDIYMTYYIEMENLNTNNFNNYFSKIEVVALVPYVNPIYEDKLNIIYFYKNIEDFKKSYLRILKEKGYYIEANKYLLKPIRINKVIVYSSINAIYDSVNYNNENYTIIKSDSYVKINN